MEVLRPQIITIGNRCFRKNPLHTKYKTDKTNTEQHAREQYNSVAAYDDDAYCDEVCDAFVNIEETASGFQTQLDVPSAYFKICVLNLTVIQGRDKKGVLSAKSRIDIIVESARQKLPFTHFLSIPVNSTAIKTSFSDFKDDVLRFCDRDCGVDSSLFQNPLKLHMTLGTLALVSDKEIDQATQLLQQCQQDIVDPILRSCCLETRVRGLEYMNDDPSSVDVLYAQIHTHGGSDKLQTLADRLVDKFNSAGLLQQQYDRVKLHITVMNTLFRKDPGSATMSHSGSSGRVQKERESFDATNILKNFKDYDFGAYTIDSVHLSQLHSFAKDGYYKPAAVLNLQSVK